MRSKPLFLAATLLGLALAGCGQAAESMGSPERCQALRRDFDKAFADAVTAGSEKRAQDQSRHVKAAEDKFLTMQAEGCCKEKGVCPPLNVR